MSHTFLPSAGARALVLAILAAAPLRAQDAPGSAVSLRADNDFFLFWRAPRARTDHEYTHGTSVVTRRVRTDTAAGTTRWTEVQISQRIYTPTLWNAPGGERPFAGWLATTASAGWADSSTARVVSVALGVVGPPSGAERVQTWVHQMRGHPVTGWEGQLATETLAGIGGRVVRYRPAVRAGALGADVSVSAGADAGNGYTGADAGARVRAGLGMSHPWLGRRTCAALYATASMRGAWVARDVTLDGGTLLPSPPVQKERWLATRTASLVARAGRTELSYAWTRVGRSYRTGPRSHMYGSLSLAFY